MKTDLVANIYRTAEQVFADLELQLAGLNTSGVSDAMNRLLCKDYTTSLKHYLTVHAKRSNRHKSTI